MVACARFTAYLQHRLRSGKNLKSTVEAGYGSTAVKNKFWSYRRKRQPTGAAALISSRGLGLTALALLAVIVSLIASFFLVFSYCGALEHRLSNCWCVTQAKQAEESIKHYQPVGLSEDELMKALGSSKCIKYTEDEKDLHQIWVYPKLCMTLHLKNHRCSAAEPLSSYH